jgi:cell division protein FtsA
MEEIFQMINREIISSGAADVLGGGVVLTGGATLMNGIPELAEFVFDLPVKRAAPENMSGFADMVSSPSFSTAVGLVSWGLETRAPVQRSVSSVAASIRVNEVKDRLKGWFADMF